MRGALLAVLLCPLGCNQILSLEDPPRETDPCTGICAGADPVIADPGFETGAPAKSYVSGTGSVRSIRDAGAHSGARMLEMKLRSCPSYASAHVYVSTPVPAPVLAPAQGGGPALAFWSRMTGTHAVLRAYAADGTGGSITVPREAQWRRGIICLDPTHAGRAQELLFYYHAASGCMGTIPTETAFIDDLEVTVDPSCPAM
jgi:hypothetical protein